VAREMDRDVRGEEGKDRTFLEVALGSVRKGKKKRETSAGVKQVVTKQLREGSAETKKGGCGAFNGKRRSMRSTGGVNMATRRNPVDKKRLKGEGGGQPGG